MAHIDELKKIDLSFLSESEAKEYLLLLEELDKRHVRSLKENIIKKWRKSSMTSLTVKLNVLSLTWLLVTQSRNLQVITSQLSYLVKNLI